MTASQPKSTIDRRRYRRIIRFFAGVILHVLWWDLLLGRLSPRRVRHSRPDRFRRLARRFRDLAVEMGGVMIKAGQFLSSRVDVLPPEITQELAGLQDEVPPEPLKSIREVVIRELGQPPEAVFVGFQKRPQAAASLGQTHRARLPEGHGGHRVVVKVQRLGIEKLVETDLAALRMVAGWLRLYRPLRRRADVARLVQELARTTWEELDYVAEAENAARFKAMFASDPGVLVPAVYQDFSTRRVLTLEDVEHIKITDLAGLDAAGVSRVQVARRVMEVYLYQVFEEGFFHADPHPGNLFVQPMDGTGDGGRPFRLIFVDFGMVGRLPVLMGEPLRDIVRGLALRDAHRLVTAFQQLNFLLPGADVERVEEATAQLLDRFWGMSLDELTSVSPNQVQDLALEFRDLLFDLPFQVPQDFIFLGRAIGLLSGLATSLDPHFNPWAPVEAYGQRLLRDRHRWPSAREAVKIGVDALRPLLSLPAELETFLVQSRRGELTVRVVPDRSLQRQFARVEQSAQRVFWGMIVSALLVAGTVLYVNQQFWLGVGGWALAGIMLLGSMLLVRRH